MTLTETEEVVGKADFLVLTLPLSPSTTHLIGVDVLEAMKPGRTW